MILLSGGTGLLGLAILDQLRARHLHCTAIVRTPTGAATVTARGATPLVGSVEDPATWARAGNLTAIIHAAALLRSSRGWAAFEQVNVTGTRLAVERALGLGIPFIHISSVAVYGDTSRLAEGTVAEDHPPSAIPAWNLYARSKRLAESVVREAMDRGLQGVILRPCPIYGPGDRLFLPRLVAAARRGWIPLIGRGDRAVPLVHATSVAEGVMAALDLPGARGGTFNLTEDGAITAAGIVEGIGLGAGHPMRTIRVPEGMALAGADLADLCRRVLPAGRIPGTIRTGIGYWRGGNPFSSALARRRLGWRPVVAHREAIAAGVRGGLGRGE